MATAALKLAPEVYWVGALNPKLRIFDIIMRTEQGTTYNAYLIRGQEKTALVETVKRGFAEEMFERLQSVMALDRIDYIVLNHLEPDHSGSLEQALQRMPKARVVISKNGVPLLRELINRDVNPLAVGTGDVLDLGGKTLHFITAPFLHWPDTMFTHLPEERILFPCDFLGSHYSHEDMLADRVGDFSRAFRYYYDHIMRPFKTHVLKGLDAVEGLDLNMVAPSHGPILNQEPRRFFSLYREWSTSPSAPPEGSLLIFYVSAYGLTGQLAKALAEGAQSLGLKTTLMDLVGTEWDGSVLEALEAAQGIAVGSCTINGDAVKPIWELLASLATIHLKGKWAAAFGSYGWSGEAVPMIEERLKSLKFKLAASGLRVRFTPRPEDLSAAYELGRTLAQKIKAVPLPMPDA